MPVPDQPETYHQVSTLTSLECSLARYDLRGPTLSILPASELPRDAVPVQPTTNGIFT
jgi:hypothetical protein